MAELILRCEYGKRVKDGRVLHPSTCDHRASGIFRVIYSGRRPVRYMFLCAEHSVKMVNHVSCVTIKQGDREELLFFHDVQAVDLIKSFTTESVVPVGEGAKHWTRDEPDKPLDTLPSIVSKTVKRGTTKGSKPLDIKKFLDNLGRHDDGH